MNWLPLRVRGAAAIVAVIISLLWLAPSCYAIYISLTSPTFNANGTSGTVFTGQHYIDAATTPLLPRYYLNSLIISVVGTVLVAIAVIGAGYAISRLRFRGQNLLYVALLIGLMIPGTSIAVPAFIEMFHLGLINNYLSVILVESAIGTPFGLVIMKNFFDEFPKDVEDAARIDGAGALRILLSVVLPNTKSSLAVVLLWTTLNSWNDFLFPLLFMTDSSMKTVALAPLAFEGQFGTAVGSLFAVLILVSIPVVALYVIGQRYLEQGISTGGLKL